MAFTIAAFLSFFIAQMAFQTPNPGESWLQMDEDPRELKSLYDLSIPITAISFGTDIYIFVLPMLGIAKLKLAPRQRLGVTLIFLIGLMFESPIPPVLCILLMMLNRACVASFLTLYYKIYLNNNTTDVTWASMPVNITMSVLHETRCPNDGLTEL